jgi:hypothetical protein
MASAIKKKITPRDFNPKKILGLSEETRSLKLGVVIGMANDIVTRTNDQGEIMEGLVGQFGFKPQEGGEPLRSYVLWLPSGMGGDLIAGAKLAKAGEAQPVEFAFLVGVVRAENPAGYEWTLTPMIEPKEADPLAALEAKIAAAPALEDGTKGKSK